MSAFYDFWSDAVNVMDKLLCFIFTFAVLLLISVLYTALEIGGLLCISTPKSAEIGTTVFEILWFFCIFKMAAGRHLGFWKSYNFICWRGPEGWDASPCQISSKWSIRCGDIMIFWFLFKDGGHVPFWICWNILGPPVKSTLWFLSLCTIVIDEVV